MVFIKTLSPEIEEKIKSIKNKYPNHKINITSNSQWKPEKKNLKGTYTLSYSGPKDINFEEEIEKIK